MRAAKLASSAAAVFTAITLGTGAGHAHELEQVNTVFEHAIPNIAGKSLIAQVVTYAPGASHRPIAMPGQPSSLRSCAVWCHSQPGDDEPVKVYRIGEGFYEVPGSRLRVSENASDRRHQRWCRWF